jgi:thiosulfate dehydrogenase [quinone] large subunit
MSVQQVSRRSLLTGSAVAVAAAVAGYLVARDSDAASAKPSTAAANGYGPRSDSTPKPLVALAEVGSGGTIAGGVVVTRTAGGDVHGVSATCTHQGCSVQGPRDGKVTCPCHSSEFDAVTGRVLRGPASRPLPPVPVHVQGDQVYRG